MALLSDARTSLNAVVPGLPLGDVLLGDIGAFRKGFVFEIIDTLDDKAGKEALMTKSLVLNPRVYTISEPFVSTLTPSEDDTIVTEENGILIREIVLEGTTGITNKTEDALSRGSTIGTNASGIEHFHELRDMFRRYGELKKDPLRSSRIRMIFHNVKEDDHFVVVPRMFETPRDAKSNRFHLNYRITLAAIQPYPPPPPQLDFLGLLGGFGQAIKDITSSVNTARANLVELIDAVDILRDRIRNPDQFFVDTALCTNASHDLIDGVTVTIALSQEFFAATNDLLEEVQEDLENDIDSPPTEDEFRLARLIKSTRAQMEQIQQHTEQFSPPLGDDIAAPFAGDRNLTNADLRDNTAGASKGTRTRLALGSARRSGLDLGAFNSSRLGSIAAGDTIDGIATRENVPREVLIAINDLRFPYIARGGGPGTLEPGATILIPVLAAGQSTNTTPSGVYLTPEEILYGVDLALDPDLAEAGIFDVLVDTTHGSLDAQQVKGVNNATQGIQIIVSTERGATDFISDLGIKRTPGVKGTVANMLVASMYLREAILSDPRVELIQSTRITLAGDVLSQEISPQLIGDRDGVTVVVPFGKAAQ
ncbi:MAG: hypothetical protein O7G84_01285 [Gammaproteobacteria bacterium]|nr:hypothetical protein [Gammaproteobacteria bacterium]